MYEQEIEFWGLRISTEGISPDPGKVEAHQYISHPKTGLGKWSLNQNPDI